MPKTFDISMLQTMISDHIKEMSDILTSGEDVQNYVDFCTSIFAIKAMMDYFYTPDSRGNLPLMDEKQKMELFSLYGKAIEKAVPLLNDEAAGPAGIRMNSIVKEMLPLLHTDHMALEMAGGAKSMPLPEIISKGRTRAIDLGQQPIKTEPGKAGFRLKTENNGEVTDGFFMPERTVDIKKSYGAFLDEMEKKYAPVYKPLIDHFRNLTLKQAFESETMSYDKFDMYPSDELNGKSTEEKKTIIKEKFFDRFWSKAGLNEASIVQVSGQADYLKFTDEFYNAFLNVYHDHKSYMGDRSLLNLETGSNLDRRNTAMYRMACFFGKPELIPETRPMIVVRNGEPAIGTFMAQAYGVDTTILKADSPMLKYKPEAFETPEVFDDIAAMQALDYICGNVDRRPGNFLLRFAPEDAENAKLVGISLVSNGLSFGDASETKEGIESFVKLSEMGVIGEDSYNAICMMTKEQMEIMLSDCKLSQGEIDKAWERKEALKRKIEEDKAFFSDKEAGYTEAGRIRLVKKDEWSSYSIRSLGETHGASHFRKIADAAETARQKLQEAAANKEKEALYERFRVEAGAKAPEQNEVIPVPVGKVIGNGILQHAPEPDNGPEENVTKLVIPSMTHVPSTGYVLSRRYLLSYEENGETKEVFFTPELDGGVRVAYNLIFKDAIEKNPKYEDELLKLRDYYSTDDVGHLSIRPEFSKTPWRKLGVSADRFEHLQEDQKFKTVLKGVSNAVSNLSLRNVALMQGGLALGEGTRIDTRNAASSDVAEIIGADYVLAKSKAVQVMCDGRVIDGTIMDRVNAVDLKDIPVNHPVSQIPANTIDEVCNTAEGLRSIADLQILDYLCLNFDRHHLNMMFRFEDLGTDHPRFVGVVGIDNDSSFGTDAPSPDSQELRLPSLNSFRVISEEMVKSVRDPKTAEKIGAKLRAGGLSEDEVNAALKRLERIKKAVDEKRLRVVKADEWAKGDNTLGKLCGNEITENYFNRIKSAFTSTCAKGAEYKENHNGQVEPYEKKEPKFAKCQKVDHFGDTALSNKEFEKLEQKASKEFLDRIKRAAKTAPDFQATSEYNVLVGICSETEEMLEVFGQADPLFSFTSGTYKDVKTACKNVNKLAERLRNNMNEELSVKDSKKLRASLNKLSDKCAAYLQKKVNEIERGENPGKYYQARKDACVNAIRKVADLQKKYYEVIIAQEANKSMIHTSTKLLKLSQAKLSGLSGGELRKKVAEVIYYKGLARMDLETKNEGSVLKKALKPSTMEKQRDIILATPAFKVLSDMNDNELRNLAAQKGGEKLIRTFVRETAKNMQRDKQERNPMLEKLQNLYKGKSGQNKEHKPRKA